MLTRPTLADCAAAPAPPAKAVVGIGWRHAHEAELLQRPADLRHLPLDMSRLTPFLQRVYERARAIPPGQVLTYGELAAELGDRNLARTIGQAMGANPFAPVVPCHRVLAAGGQPGGFSASGGAITKWRLLEIEGYRPGGEPSLFD